MMGRSYAQEISELADIYQDAMNTTIDELTGFVNESLESILRAVGSGGSATTCVLASILHEQETGSVSRHVTPLELLDFPNFHGASVLLVSAGGNNRNMLVAFEHVNERYRQALGALCSSGDKSKLDKACASQQSVHLHDADIPNRDGFLATNLLLAACVWLARAYGPYVSSYSLPLDLDGLLRTSEEPAARTTDDLMACLRGLLNKLADASTIGVLHDVVGKAATTDLESKLVESGVRNVQPTDYRNFTHGRHNWLDRHHSDTGAIMLTNPKCTGLVTRTFVLLSTSISVTMLHTELEGFAAMISLLVQRMCVVGVLGEQSGLDPGRPGWRSSGENCTEWGRWNRRHPSDSRFPCPHTRCPCPP